jgi:hypothetical protein
LARPGSVKKKKLKEITITVVKNLIYLIERQINNKVKLSEY